MSVRQYQVVSRTGSKAVLIRVLALTTIFGTIAVQAPHAEAQLFRRLRARFAPPAGPAQPPARVPQYQQQQQDPRSPLFPRIRANRAATSDAQPSRPPAAATNSESLGGSILERNNAGSDDSPRATLGIQASNRGGVSPAVEVVEFKEHSKADEAGLRVGDLIYGIDNRATPNIEALARELSRRRPGETVRLRVQRNRRIGDLEVPIVALPTDRSPQVAPAPEAARSPQAARAAATARRQQALPTPPSKGGKLGVSSKDAEGSRGAIVTTIEPSSPAEKAGLKPGDRIVSVDGRMISDRPTLIREIGSHAPGTPVVVQYVRGDQLYALRLMLDDGVNRPTKADAKSGESNQNTAAQTGSSVLDDVGAALGDIFGSSESDAEELPPPAAKSAKPAAPAKANNKAKAALDAGQKKAASVPDEFAFGDDEPINQVIFEAPANAPVEAKKPALADDPPSLTAADKPKPKSKGVAELEAEIQRLEQQLSELKSGDKK